MESNKIWTIVIIILFSLMFILKGINGIKEKRIEFKSRKYGYNKYVGWQAMAPSVVMLLIGFLPYIVGASFIVSEFFHNENLFPILVISFVPISWILMMYLISKER